MAETAAAPRPAQPVERGAAYEEELLLRARHQAALIRAGRLDLIDRKHLAEEIESLGVSGRGELRNRLEVLMINLLKWQLQPMHRSRSWRSTIRTQRARIERVLKDSPSLRREVAGLSRVEYGTARKAASAQTGFALRTFPKALPCTPEQVLDDDFYPSPIDEP